VLEGGVMLVGLIPLLLADGAFQDIVRGALAGGAPDASLYDSTVNGILANPLGTALMLFATIGMIAGALVFCRFIERRKLATMGLRKGRVLREYLVGLLVGAAMLSAALGICVLAGTMTPTEATVGATGVLIALFFVGFVFQGMSEELICRGYFCVSLARRQRMAVAIGISSLTFGLLHVLNSGFTFLAFVNIVVFGVFAALYMLKRGSIWGIGAIHTAWNFMQGCFFGISVSGASPMPSLFTFAGTEGGQLLNGGSFGLEGGLAVTLVLACSIVAVLLTKGAERPDAGAAGAGAAEIRP
jgi:membrane protease YdiL (CAAX protease family)